MGINATHIWIERDLSYTTRKANVRPFLPRIIGRERLNVARWLLSKLPLMRSLPISILGSLLATMSILAATPEGRPEASPTVPAAAAEAGKDVVHQLNNAFAKVFEIIAPSVVI